VSAQPAVLSTDNSELGSALCLNIKHTSCIATKFACSRLWCACAVTVTLHAAVCHMPCFAVLHPLSLTSPSRHVTCCAKTAPTDICHNCATMANCLSCSCIQGSGAAQGQPDCGSSNPQVGIMKQQYQGHQPPRNSPAAAGCEAARIDLAAAKACCVPSSVRLLKLHVPGPTVRYGVLCGAACRVFGNQLAEMPFVATKTGFRRAGHCRRLIKVRTPCPRH
jgi:hypothetical protein